MKKYMWGNPTMSKEDEKSIENSPFRLIDPPNHVEAEGNTIYFYSEVDPESVMRLNKELREMDKQHQRIAVDLDLKEPPPINIHIHSTGGELFSGFAGCDAILNCVSPVHTRIEGCAASAATLISLAGDHRSIGPNSFILIHQLSSGFWGKHDEWEDELTNLDNLMEQVKAIYLEHTKISYDELVKILKKDLWFDAETALSYGLVDEID